MTAVQVAGLIGIPLPQPALPAINEAGTWLNLSRPANSYWFQIGKGEFL
jgi:hypothetical protein